MIPVKLTLEGIYSYQARQTIDFSKLTEAGLFGIFGAVGSGKSSILEAISFALYGETERLNAREKRAYNMMNLKSNRFFVEFEFVNYENKIYRATRDFRRNLKRFDDVKVHSTTFYEFVNEDWIPLEHTNSELLLGLSYENFKRTIIIPQGQFKEFLELGPTDRTNMMKEIFQLGRFDLQHKTAALQKENQSNLDQLAGKLSGFEEINQEIIQSLKDQLKLQSETLSQVQKEHEKSNQEFQNLKLIKTDFESLNQKEIEFEKFRIQKEAIDKKREQANLYERIFTVFHPILTEQMKLKKSEIEISSELENQRKEYIQTSAEIENLKEEIQKLKEDFEQLPEKKKEALDLELLIQILAFEQEILTKSERTKKGILAVQEVKTKQEEINTSIENLEKEIDEWKKKQFSSDLILKVGNWFSEFKLIIQNIDKQNNRLIEVKDKIKSIDKQLKDKEIDFENFEEKFQRKMDDLKNKKKKLEEKKSHFEVQQKLAQYSDELHDGEACPLCGSLDHPNIVQISDVSMLLKEVDQDLVGVEKRIENIQKEWEEIRSIAKEKSFFEKQISEENEVLKKLQNEKETHQTKFVWKEFNSSNFEDFDSQRKLNSELEKTIEIKNEAIKKLRESLRLESEKLDTYSKTLEKFKIEEAEKQAQISQNLAHLKVLDYSNFKSRNSEEVKREWQELKIQNQSIEEKYTQFHKQLNELNPKASSQKTSIEIAEKQWEQLKEELANIQKSIDSLLHKQNLESLDSVEEVLKLKLDLPSIRKEIEDFTIMYETFKNSIQELKDKLKDLTFDQVKFEQSEESLNLLIDKLKGANENVVKSKAELERIEKEFEAKKKLIVERDKLENRAGNLKTLFNLFKASGFVQFVSSIYLRQLCDYANERFHRMTRNQLSLQLNENNDFEIIDYLNEGRSRSVKTLSGGQSFQVSLSLALALAESVQTSVKAEKNFFFIDEGFGTQDVESVNIVFETLMNLQKENRIVGIISHVEELKEKISMALNIVNHQEKGSVIEWVSG